MENLPNVPYEYLIDLSLETGYPDILNLCKSHPNFKKICDDNHFWKLLLQQDYFDIVNDNIFENPKEVYSIIYQAFNDDYSLSEQIFDLFKLASKADNVQLLKVVSAKYPKQFNSSGVKEVLFADAMMTGAFNVGKYLLTNEKLGIRENAIYKFYLNRNKIGADEFFNIILNDERVYLKHLIKYAIKYNYLNDLILLLNNNELVNYAFNEAILDNNYEILKYLLDNYDIDEKLIEDGIVYNKDNIILEMLLNSNKYDPNKLFIALSKFDAINAIQYLLLHHNITSKTLKNAALNAVHRNNIDILNLLIKQPNFDPYFSNNILIKEAYDETLEYLINNLINNNNYEKILNDIINDIKSETLKQILGSKLFKKMTKKKYQVLDNLLLILLNYKNVNEDKVLIILNKLKNIDDNILLIAAKKNLLKVIDKLLDFNLNNTDEAFEIALVNDNVMAAAMINNYDMCNYINRIKGFNSCDQLNRYIEESFDDVIEECLLPLLDNYNDDDEIDKFVNKYSVYLTVNRVNRVIESIYSRYDDYEY